MLVPLRVLLNVSRVHVFNCMIIKVTASYRGQVARERIFSEVVKLDFVSKPNLLFRWWIEKSFRPEAWWMSCEKGELEMKWSRKRQQCCSSSLRNKAIIDQLHQHSHLQWHHQLWFFIFVIRLMSGFWFDQRSDLRRLLLIFCYSSSII